MKIGESGLKPFVHIDFSNSAMKGCVKTGFSLTRAFMPVTKSEPTPWALALNIRQLD